MTNQAMFSLDGLGSDHWSALERIVHDENALNGGTLTVRWFERCRGLNADARVVGESDAVGRVADAWRRRRERRFRPERGGRT